MSAPEARLEAARRRWSLGDLTPVTETPTSWIYRADGRFCLKLVKTHGMEEMAGAPLLRWWDGAGAVRLRDAGDDAMLLDWVEGAPLGDAVRAGGDGDSFAGLAALIRRLHAPRGAPPGGLDPLERRSALLLACTEGEKGRAAALCRHLLETAPPAIPLHGDLHHDNILAGLGGWTAIDPKGVLGDPAYDCANLFLNPIGRPDLARDPARIEALATALAEGTGYPRPRILGWAAAHAALSALWDAGAGKGPVFAEGALTPLLAAAEAAAEVAADTAP